MAPTVDMENQRNSVKADTCEILSVFRKVDIMRASAWQKRMGVRQRSTMSQGISRGVFGFLSMIEPRRDARRFFREVRRVTSGGAILLYFLLRCFQECNAALRIDLEKYNILIRSIDGFK